ncbi:S-adenosyl-L-methionine-dependent methyltransferase [Gigaspora rosea]|uniref:S-adenosyl-L-methionine-dependent methyltransferase n=1 Tax=Gigaspora rosea TaxID=44941 RepID=A0A397W9Q2_9GLOM|nr:S-adenosyl-L-methionine-dependent methyltransferase [Gigaspora rosea]CAG8448233.1 3749_t:CDS:2 [Gigaspora rosea]
MTPYTNTTLTVSHSLTYENEPISDSYFEHKYEWIGGRLCEEDENGPYPLPYDSNEIDRLDLQHYIIRYALNGYFTAPVNFEKVKRVCDVGCGSGIWMMEMSAIYPNTRFYGCDVRSAFPESTCPENCEFSICNILKGLIYPSGYFDYVYQRTLLGSIPEKEWKPLISELVRCTAINGLVELTELAFWLNNAGPHYKIIQEKVYKALEIRGINSRVLNRLPEFLKQAGLVNIGLKIRKIPCGKWGGQIGEYMRDFVMQAMNFYKIFCARQDVITDTDVDEWDYDTEILMKEFEEYKTFATVVSIVGRKPEPLGITIVEDTRMFKRIVKELNSLEYNV